MFQFCCSNTVLSNFVFQVSSQSLPRNVTTKRNEWKVIGFADRLALPQKFLDFCGSFPIYNIEKTSKDAIISSLQKGMLNNIINFVHITRALIGRVVALPQLM